MSRITIQFPETDVVAVVFCYKNHLTEKSRATLEYDENNVVVEAQKNCLKTYYYRLPPALVGHVKTGDMVVVNCATGYQVAEVKMVNAIPSAAYHESLAYVVGIVDKDCYFKFREDKKKLEVMRAQLEVEKKRIESMVTYELIAERNPEFKAMLDAFKALGGTIE